MTKSIEGMVRFFSERWNGRHWRVNKLVCRIHKNVYRVSARVAGQEVWFESDDVPLVFSIEGFASMFLVPALYRRATLALCGAVDAQWIRNVGELLSIFRHWWAFPDTAAIDCQRFLEIGDARRSGSILFFTGGVDSFYTLLKGPAVDALVYVHGFDIRLDEHERMAQFERGFRRIAQETGHRAIVIRTNLRQHPQFRKVNWEFTHGGALAGVAHLISASFGRAVISSSDTGLFNVPWGTHQDTDKLYSSGSMVLQHFGESVYRLDKLRAVIKEPLVRQHLHVCWENRVSEMNCCQCEKCLRTMVYLAGMGELEEYPVFAHGCRDVCARIDNLPTISGSKDIQEYWVDSLQLSLPKDMEAAVRRLLARSGWYSGQVKREDLSRKSVFPNTSSMGLTTAD